MFRLAHLSPCAKAGASHFSTDFHNSFESHPSRKPFPSANLNPTVSNNPRPFESLTSYSCQAVTFVLPCSLIVRAHPRHPFGAPPPSAEQSQRSFLYVVTSLLPYLTMALSSCPDRRSRSCRDPVRVTAHYCFNSFSCNTYVYPFKCCKQKTYGLAKPFRNNTYKKHRG